MDGYMYDPPISPYPPITPGLNPRYLIRMMDPIVERGVWENRVFGTRHAVREAALTAHTNNYSYNTINQD